MRKIFKYFCIALLTLSFTSVSCYAIDFKAGAYFFDNSKLHFNNVKFVVGNDSFVTVIEMTPVTDNRWEINLEEDYLNLDGYCFIDSEIQSGEHNMGLDDFLNHLQSNEQGFRQTKVRDNTEQASNYLIGWVFYPLNDFEISDGYWRPQDSYNVEPSRTVPLIHINTQNAVTIADKENYIDGTFWLDNCDIEGYQSIGSESAPLTIQIKGRGNWTWMNMYKKPYKLKFAQKVSPMGLDNSKHFILLPNAVDWSGYLRNETGFELSRQLGMPYTTRQLPVEVILNDEYIGLYFLCEKIRVESGRVDIMEQNDNETNPDNVSGGWLLELAYDEPPVIAQYENNDSSNGWISFISQSPEIISQIQRDYIYDFIYKGDSCIYVTDKQDCGWEQYFDINSLARFYVIHEVMENVEAFSGSLFMYKDFGENEKLQFGPVWDFDNSLNPVYHIYGNNFIFNYNTPFQFIWIKELLKFPHFQQVIRQVWKEFKYNNVLDKIYEHANEWRQLLVDVEYNDKMRWRTYGSNHSENSPTEYLNLISRKVAWLNEQWGVPEGDVNCDFSVNAADVTAIYNYILNGDETYKNTSDVNGDGLINIADITAIYNYILN